MPPLPTLPLAFLSTTYNQSSQMIQPGFKKLSEESFFCPLQSYFTIDFGPATLHTNLAFEVKASCFFLPHFIINNFHGCTTHIIK